MLGVQFLCDLVHLRDERQSITQHGHDLLRGSHVHHLEEGRTPRQHAERHACSFTHHPRVMLRERLIVGLGTHDGRLSVLATGPETLQEELQPPQSTVEPQESTTARLWVVPPLVQVHQFILQLIFNHGLDSDVLRAVLALQVCDQDLDLVDSILGDEAEDAPQAVEKPVRGQTHCQHLHMSTQYDYTVLLTFLPCSPPAPVTALKVK